MLTIKINGGRLWDRRNRKFIYTKDTNLVLEYSLVSISKWEAYYHKPFLSKDTFTKEEIIYFIKCMTISQNVDPNVYLLINNEHMNLINAYIKNPMTATWFSEKKSPSKKNNEQITSELIYYWMVALQIPFKPCEKWNFNRLMTLIRIANIKSQPPKKYSKRDVMSQNAALNAARRNKLGTSG